MTRWQLLTLWRRRAPWSERTSDYIMWPTSAQETWAEVVCKSLPINFSLQQLIVSHKKMLLLKSLYPRSIWNIIWHARWNVSHVHELYLTCPSGEEPIEEQHIYMHTSILLSFRIGQYCRSFATQSYCHSHLYWTRSTCLTCFSPSSHTFFFKRPAGHSTFSFLSTFHHCTLSGPLWCPTKTLLAEPYLKPPRVRGGILAHFFGIDGITMAWKTLLCKNQKIGATRLHEGSSLTAVLQRSKRKGVYRLK